jgi:hypothetical protein
MKGGGKDYPNRGVKIDPRAITSAKMSEGLKVYSGYLKQGYHALMGEAMIKQSLIEKIDKKIQSLIPYEITRHKFKSSFHIITDTHIIEFFRTSHYNYKIYAFQHFFIKESVSLLSNIE